MSVAGGGRLEADGRATAGDVQLPPQLGVLAVDDLVPHVQGHDLQEGPVRPLRDALHGLNVLRVRIADDVQIPPGASEDLLPGDPPLLLEAVEV